MPVLTQSHTATSRGAHRRKRTTVCCPAASAAPATSSTLSDLDLVPVLNLQVRPSHLCNPLAASSNANIGARYPCIWIVLFVRPKGGDQTPAQHCYPSDRVRCAEPQGMIEPEVPAGTAASVFAIFDEGKKLQFVGFSKDLRNSLRTVFSRRPDKAFFFKCAMSLLPAVLLASPSVFPS